MCHIIPKDEKHIRYRFDWRVESDFQAIQIETQGQWVNKMMKMRQSSYVNKKLSSKKRKHFGNKSQSVL